MSWKPITKSTRRSAANTERATPSRCSIRESMMPRRRSKSGQGQMNIWPNLGCNAGSQPIFCSALLDTELVPLKREANDPLGIAVPFRRSAPWWRWLLSASLGIGIVYAVTNGHIIFGIACAGLLVWLIYRAPNRNAPLSELQGELSHLLVILGDV